MAAIYDKAAQTLNLGSIEQRFRDGATLKLSGGQDRQPVIVKFRSVQDAENLPSTNAHFVTDPTRRSRRRMADRSGDPTRSSSATSLPAKGDAALKLVVEEFQRQDRVGLACNGAFILPLIRIDQLDTCAFYVRRWLPASLLERVEARIPIASSAELFHIVHDIWTALAFMQQGALGIPHGNLKLSNVLCDSPADSATRCYLTDLSLLPDAEYEEGKMRDFQMLGHIIWQLCACSPEHVDLGVADAQTREARWTFLGEYETDWKMIARRLMVEGTYRLNDFDAAAKRDEMLSTVCPPGFSLSPIPAPGGTAQPADPLDHQIDRLHAAVEAGEWASAIPQLCKLLQSAHESNASPSQQQALSDALTRAVASISDDDTTEEAQQALKAAASHSGAASYRIGASLMATDPAAALPILARAIELNFNQASVALGQLYMNGGASMLPNPVRAAACFENAIRDIDSVEARFWLAVLMLRKSCPGKPEIAVEMLEHVASAQGPWSVHAHVLLGQCHAVGHGVPLDRQHAVGAFRMACEQSRLTGKADGFALNNLAVCLMHGLGTDQDAKQALEFLVQAGDAGCKGALQNQNRLPRRIYLD